MDSELKKPADLSVSVQPFDIELHFNMLIEMHESQLYTNIEAIKKETLPKIGFIAMTDKQPVAAGFLRMVEGGFAQIDTLVTDAFMDPKMRNLGIWSVVNKLLDTADDLELEGVIATTREPSIVERAKQQEFIKCPDVVLAKRLR